MEKYQCTAQAAPLIKSWLETRGGIAIWRSIDLSDPGRSITTPVKTAEGDPASKPHWSMANKPERIITSVDDVEVCMDKEVKRFRVAIRRGAQGLSFKCTDASSRRIRKAVEKAGKGAHHVFDYWTQEAVIMAPEKIIPLAEYKEKPDAENHEKRKDGPEEASAAGGCSSQGGDHPE